MPPAIKITIGLAAFYIGLRLFTGGLKALSHPDDLQWFLGNPLFLFGGSIVMTLMWQSSSITTAAVVALVASGILPLPSALAAILGANVGTTGTIWLAGLFATDMRLTGDSLRISVAHTAANTFMALALLPWVQPIAGLLRRIG